MKIIIYGAGDIGYSIAAYLALEENDIVVIDESPERIAHVSETLDVQALVGHGSYPDVLEKADARNADLLIAVSHVDEFNIMACQVAYSIFNVPTKIAHIRNSHYLDPAWRHIYNPDNIPVDFIISPEREVAQGIVENFDVPGATSVVALKNAPLSLVSIYCSESCPLLKHSLVRIGKRFPNMLYRVLCIIRDGVPIVPGPEDEIYAHDEIYAVVERSHVPQFLSAFGVESTPLEKVIIAGAGNVGIALAQELAIQMPDLSVKLIEKDKKIAHDAAQILENVVVIHGDALDVESLKEANVSSADMVVCVTNNDEVNVLSALLSKNFSSKYVTALVNSDTYPKFLPSLGVDSILNPSAITISHILSHVRQGNIKSLYVLQGGFGEVFENTVQEGSPLVGEKFRIFNVPEQSIVGGVIRDGAFVVPRSQEFIQAGDHLILLVMRDYIPNVENLFKGLPL